MAINDKLLGGATGDTPSSLDPRDHFGTVLYTGNGSTQSINGGKYDAAGSFNGSNSIAYSTVNALGSGNVAYTISAWIYLNASSHTGGIYTVWDGSATAGIHLFFQVDGGSLRIGNYGASVISSNTLAVGQWLHVAVTRDTSNNVVLYVNGSSDTTGTLSLNLANNIGIVGALATTTQNFNGLIDQVRIYDEVLSGSEITSLYNESYADSFKVNFPTGKTVKALYRLNGNGNDETGVYNLTTISNVTWKYGVNFTPDLVWIKERSDSSSHNIADSVRGSTKYLSSNLANGENDLATTITSFDTGGFSVGNDGAVNQSSQTYAAWCWNAGGSSATNNEGTQTSTVRANTDAGFSIVKYTGTGNNMSIGHGLNSTPEFALFKNLDDTTNWNAWTPVSGVTNYISLNLDDQLKTTSGSSGFSNGAPTPTVVNLDGSVWTNESGSEHIMYAFHSVDGYQKIGSYTGNGSANGPLVETGFAPAFVMIKSTDASGEPWIMMDNQRSTSNPRLDSLRANSNAAESTHVDNSVNFYDDGFQPASTWTGHNGSGNTYLYLAIAAPPETTTPVLASSFKVNTWTGDATARNIETGFEPSFVWIKSRTFDNHHMLYDSIRGAGIDLHSNTTDSKNTDLTGLSSFNTNGFSLGTSGNVNSNTEDFVSWSWKASDSTDILTAGNNINSLVSVNDDAGFSIVKWTGDGNASSTVAHGLSTAPSVIILKDMDNTRSWQVYHSSAPASYKPYGGNLEGDAAFNTSAGSNGSLGTPTSSVITFTNGSSTINNCNASGANIVAYCWRPISGYSHFGSYTGTGTASSNGITTVGFQPNLVIYKAATRQGDWLLFDSVRGAQKRIRGNEYSSESNWGTGGGLQSFDTNGFTVSTSDNTYSSNVLNETYVYMAFKMN